MNLSPHNTQRNTKWIQSEVDYNFLNLGYTIGFQNDQVLLEHNDTELNKVCPHCLIVPRYPLFFKCGHLTCLPCLWEYRRHIVMFENLFFLSNLQTILPSNWNLYISSGKVKMAKLYFNENVQTCKVYLLLRRMWKVQSIGNNSPSWDVWMSLSEYLMFCTGLSIYQ